MFCIAHCTLQHCDMQVWAIKGGYGTVTDFAFNGTTGYAEGSPATGMTFGVVGITADPMTGIIFSADGSGCNIKNLYGHQITYSVATTPPAAPPPSSPPPPYPPSPSPAPPGYPPPQPINATVVNPFSIVIIQTAAGNFSVASLLGISTTNNPTSNTSVASPSASTAAAPSKPGYTGQLFFLGFQQALVQMLAQIRSRLSGKPCCE